MTSTRSPETNLGVVTTWIPMITDAPVGNQECSTAFYSWTAQSLYDVVAFDPYAGRFLNTSLQCLPNAATLFYSQSKGNLEQTTTQLGPFACPSLYTTATTSALDNMTTFVGCCPESYYYTQTTALGPQWGPCGSSLSVGQVISYSQQIGDNSYTKTSKTISLTNASAAGLYVFGYAFADITSSATLAISSPMGTDKPTALGGSHSSTGSSPNGSNKSSSSGGSSIGTGAKAGIGVGIVLGLIGLCALGALLIMRKRRRVTTIEDRGLQYEKAGSIQELDTPKSELEAQQKAGGYQVVGLRGAGPYEIGS